MSRNDKLVFTELTVLTLTAVSDDVSRIDVLIDFVQAILLAAVGAEGEHKRLWQARRLLVEPLHADVPV